ncbi:MAG: 23S rRNA (pseudouridine(1915)-N(3))-methyltransferase RlmH [Pseudomonadota bacterium]
MKLTLHAVGRMKSGPDQELFTRYWDRLEKTGRSVGLGPAIMKELAESRAVRPADRMADEAQALLKTISTKAHVIVLDERGKHLSSENFAKRIATVRDGGAEEIAFIIGGADGLDQSVRDRADTLIAFGAMTWPHQIVRILAAEQIYRAITILSGHPYHKS